MRRRSTTIAADDLERDPTSTGPVIPFEPPLGAAAPRERPKASKLRRALGVLGPGFITGASDDDPSGIGTYAQAGAQFGFAPLWMALLTFPLMTGVQFICAKVGLVSGMGLSAVLRRHYSRRLLFTSVGLLLIANTVNAGADIGAIAAGINLLVPIPIAWLIAPIAAVILALQIWGSYELIARVFKWLALALVGYIGAGFLTHPDPHAVLRGTFVPTMRFDSEYLMMVVAILGTTISPYLFFWQASEEVEDEISHGRIRLSQRIGATRNELRIAGWDVSIGMLFSNLVTYFIIFTTAATLHAHGQQVQTAADAAMALKPLAGTGAELLLAVGLIGTGFLAVPILTGSGAYALAEGLGWPYGLSRKPRTARPFYAVIVASTIIGMLINFTGISAVTALFWTAILNGLLTPPLLVLIMIVSNNESILGERTNGRLLNVAGWATTALMSLAALALLASWIIG